MWICFEAHFDEVLLMIYSQFIFFLDCLVNTKFLLSFFGELDAVL